MPKIINYKIDKKIKRIEDINPGDYVYGNRNQLKKVIEKHDHGFLKVFKVKFIGIKEPVICTLDHKFSTKEGVKPLRDIIENDLVVYSNRCPVVLEDVKPCLNLKQTYDIELEGDETDESHLFQLANGIITSNSHSCAYGMISYQTLWLKAHFTIEFVCATLTSCGNANDGYGKLLLVIEDAQKLGIKIKQPDINKSFADFTPINDTTIVYGFSMIKGLGVKHIQEIVRAREDEGDFENYIDFLKKVDLKVINKRILEALIGSGAFDKIEKLDKKILIASNQDWATSYTLGVNNKSRKVKQKGLVTILKKINTQKYIPEADRKKSYLTYDDLTIRKYEEQTPEEFFDEKEVKMITPTSLHEGISDQIKYMNHAFYTIDLLEVPKDFHPQTYPLTSKKNIIRRLLDIRKINLEAQDELYKEKYITKTINLYKKYPSCYTLDNITLLSDVKRIDIKEVALPMWSPDKPHRNGRSFVFLTFGILKDVQKKYTKNHYCFHRIDITDGPNTLSGVMWYDSAEKLLEGIDMNDYVVMLGIKKQGYNHEPSYECISVMKTSEL